MNKVVRDAREAIADVHDGATIMLGGFGLCGIPKISSTPCERKARRTSPSSATTPASMAAARVFCWKRGRSGKLSRRTSAKTNCSKN